MKDQAGVETEAGISKELKRGTLEMMILRILSGGEMYAYQLVSALEARVGQQLQIKEGTLYPVLYRLEDAALVETRWETFERGVPRKYYRITPAGVGRLRSLIEEWRVFTAIVNRLLEAGEESR
jgi:PadR family transcriptional regulator, regulatory protein PadR